MEKEYHISVHTGSEGLPPLLEGDFFHSPELFRICERVPGDTPYLAVATDADGRVAGQMLAVMHRRRTWLPPFFFTCANIHGEGVYREAEEAGAIFPLLLQALTQELCEHHCLYIECTQTQQKMFGYRHFRAAGYFPTPWQEVCNSLHNKPPEERLTEKARRRIETSERKGVECHVAADPAEAAQFARLYRRYCKMKPRRPSPPAEYFEEISRSEGARLVVCSRNGKALGGCVVAFSRDNAYLLHLAALRKSYRFLHPDSVAVWHAILLANAHGSRHIHFMNVGLPWKHNPFRDFIRSFGGKPVAKLRWFRFNNRLANSLLKWLYKE